MEKHEFDIAVIGSGPGGYPAAIRAASYGKKVALIESNDIGGTCLNRGCIPSKALIASAELFHNIQHAKEMGIYVENISFDYAAMVARKDQVINRLRKSLEGLIRANGIKILKGFAKFQSSKELSIEGGPEILQVHADKIILASGSEPRSISQFSFDGEKILDSTSLLNLKTLPKKIVIVGGGIIGCEFASLYNLLGVEVVIIEMLSSILPTECASVTTFLANSFKKRGIIIETEAKVERIEKISKRVSVQLSAEKCYEADIALVAVGREMNLKNLDLEKIGVKLKSPSQIDVNEHMETNIPGIYAVGDIASKWWLAHVATHQGLAAASHACGHPAQMHYESIPNVIFTYPEIATVGLSLEEAKKKSRQVSVGKFPFQALGKALASNHTEGFAQLVIDEASGQILGAQVVGHEASILIGEIAIAIRNELTVECIYETMHAHPTMSEAWMESALIASKQPLHFLRQELSHGIF